MVQILACLYNGPCDGANCLTADDAENVIVVKNNQSHWYAAGTRRGQGTNSETGEQIEARQYTFIKSVPVDKLRLVQQQEPKHDPP